MIVITPAYHAEKFIDQYMDTLMNQIYQDFDVCIVIDDVNYDNTLQKIYSHPFIIKIG